MGRDIMEPKDVTPRDPKRIDRIVDLLREAWRLFPDERLTQLVINISETNHDCGPVFYMGTARWSDACKV